MIAANISMACDKPQEVSVGVNNYGMGYLVSVYFTNTSASSGLNIHLPFDDARRLATQIENAIAAHNCATARREDDDDATV